MMMRSLCGQFDCNLKATISQLDPKSDFYQTIEVERSRSGKVRHTVISPKSLQGFCTVDDGENTYLYEPSQKVLLEQGATDLKPGDLKRRAELAKRNYNFHTEGQAQIAGRKAWCVVATPKHAKLQLRRYYLDAETAYPLRLETMGPDDPLSVRFDTREIAFDVSADDAIFKPSAFGAVRHIHGGAPANVTPAQAEHLLGFRPIVPKRLPFGFEIQRMQVHDSPHFHAFILRVSDGLVKATIYQWRLSKNPGEPSSLEQSSSLSVHGIQILVLSDVSKAVRTTVLEAFKKEFLSNPNRFWGELLNTEPSIPAGPNGGTIRSESGVLNFIRLNSARVVTGASK